MYCNYFGLNERPFEMTADPKYLYLNEMCKEVLSSLFYAVQNRRGVILFIGKIGTGKTTILKALKDSLDKNTKVAFIFTTNISFKQLLNSAVVGLGLTASPKNMTVVETIHRLSEFAIEQSMSGGNVVLMIDEAQNLSKSELENLRLLSNIETRRTKLIQILLCGQPKLDYKLNRPELEQLFERISIKKYLKSLSEEDTYNYIEHRLNIAGYNGSAIFNKNSLKLIWKHSEGVPLKINKICDNSMMVSYANEKKTIDENIIKEAIRSLDYSPFKNSDPDYKYRGFNQSKLLY